MIVINDSLSIEERDVELSFVRSSGPGGQHVNKVATAVQLRYPLSKFPLQEPEFLKRIARLAGKKLTSGGVLVFEGRSHRSQKRNREEALEKLIALFRKALRRPRQRRPTRRSRASHQKRLSEKRHRGSLKQGRQRPPLDE